MQPTQDPIHDWRMVYCRKCGERLRVRVQCTNRFCPDCSKRRARRIRSALNHLFQKTEKRRTARFKLITLSESNCSDLASGVNRLVAAFRRLRQRQYWKNRVYGGAFVIEVTGFPGSWHPHIHAIVYSEFIIWERLHRDWMKVSGGRSVWITNCSLDGAKHYVTKYVTKVDTPADQVEVVSTAVRRFRLFTRFGEWHDITLPPLEETVCCPCCGMSDWIVDFEVERLCRSP